MKFIVLLFLLFSYHSFAEIIITPNPANSSTNINIEVINQYASAAGIRSATITQTGNNFVISQIVDVTCSLPAAPIISSTFKVGTLNNGEYSVTANIQNIGFPSSTCPDNTITQNATFNVVGVRVIPVGGFYWKSLLIGILFASLFWFRKKIQL
ncbi:MAG: hypothetical protein L3J53_05835 [Proteobacteria bacterium]|nr:hypothetical protein [Pseudomonadota bacterium]